MTAVLPPSSSSPSPSQHSSTASPKSNLSSLPPLVTTPTSQKRPPSSIQKPSSYALNRMSQYSTTSNASQKQSRPGSSILPTFHSSLPYAQVRDFAYPTNHPLHYGPPAEPSTATSGQSTPAFEFPPRRLSDPPSSAWNTSRLSWSTTSWTPGEQLPQMAYGGSPKDHGPPYSEDEDLQSPVVVSSRSKKGKENFQSYDQERGYFAGANGDGSETYYVSGADETANGPGGELVTYPPEQARHSRSVQGYGGNQGSTLHSGPRNASLNVGSFNNESRYSRDYQFTIASPDEEMHGKAVALFDFARENENELPLVEGQVIWVSYRHGQGWLVAQDPKSGESGLVPEEYVRLLRDIEGEWSAELSGEATGTSQVTDTIPEETSPTTAQAETQRPASPSKHKSKGSDGSTSSEKDKKKPIVSTFSTSSKDLDPYHHPLLGTQSGQQPPQIVHYGSQANTPLQSPALTRRVSDKEPITRSSSKRKEKDKGKKR